jgi:hypothetical protein
MWKIARKVVSQVSYENIEADGYGSFIVSRDDPNLIFYSEKVTIRNLYLNTSIIGKQKYEYKFDITTSSISKYFNDGRFFYTINIADHKIGGEHLCLSDKYTSNYIFGKEKFRLAYSVAGSFKNYEIITDYTRINERI